MLRTGDSRWPKILPQPNATRARTRRAARVQGRQAGEGPLVGGARPKGRAGVRDDLQARRGGVLRIARSGAIRRTLISAKRQITVRAPSRSCGVGEPRTILPDHQILRKILR